MDEKFLYHVWDAGHLASELRTVSGKPVKILFPGQFNTFRGPDFINAILNLDGHDVQGAIEIHQSTLDWQRHHHQEDHYYNSVVLHVVLNHNGELPQTQKENGEWVDILQMRYQLSEEIQKLLRDYQDQPSNKTSSFCDRLSALDNEHLQSILYQHGIQRFEGKVKRYNASLVFSDFDQLLYEGLMEAAGYDKNKLNMLQLAQSIPYASLKSWKQSGMTLYELQGILACSSGLLAKAGKILQPDQTEQIKSAYEKQPYYARNLSLDWQLFRIRPASHPLPRLLKIATFLFDHLDTGLLNGFLNRVEADAVGSAKRFTLYKQAFHQPDKEQNLGNTMLENSYLNIYLPLMYLYARKTAQSALAASLKTSWREFKPLADNFILRYMSLKINPSQHKILHGKSLFQQGMIDIYYRYCRYHQCPECKMESIC